ncbi:MAG: hypothetical protein V1847_03290 [Candidatus Diapherotrites archaeon]
MTPEEEFFEYVKQNPQYYSVMRAPVYMNILNQLKQQALDVSELKGKTQVEEQDLDLILQSLEQLGLVEEIELKNRVLYSLSVEGETFLDKYEKGFKVFGQSEPSI